MSENRLEPAQRKLVVGSDRVFSGVNATRQTISSGASMKAMTRALKDEREGSVFCMASPQRPSWRALDHAVIGQHDEQVGDKDDDRDGRAERPVQLMQIFIVHQRGRHL